MRRRDRYLSLARRRSGQVAVMFTLLLTALLGMVGLAVDCGLLLVAQREAQNAADAAALAAAMASLYGQNYQTAASTFVTTYNGLPNNHPINNPPLSGPHSSSSKYFEAIVSYNIPTLFIRVIPGALQTATVQARAVAGYETVVAGDGVGVLDPTATPGLTVTGGGSLVSNGPIMVNSQANPAATVNGGGYIEALAFFIGGPAVSGTFSGYPSGGSPTMYYNQGIMPDPLIDLPTPGGSTTGVAPLPGSPPSGNNNTATTVSGWSTTSQGDVKVTNGNTVTLNPGVYSSIQITGGTVTFNPGVYVLSPQKNITNTLDITGGTVTGSGVMFYNTGGDYVPSTGYPDYNDAGQYDPGPSGTNAPPSSSSFQNNFGGIQLDGSKANITLSPIATVGDPFSGMLIYQRRANTSTIKITGGTLSLTGTLYNKWGMFNISGGGSYQAQFVAGSMQLSGQSTINLTYSGNNFGRANEVFLVE